MNKAWMTISFLLLFFGNSYLYARHIFLNGVDITNLRNETMVNVSLRIAANGDVYIEGGQYKATESYEYVPQKGTLKLTPKGFKNKPMERQAHEKKQESTDEQIKKQETQPTKKLTPKKILMDSSAVELEKKKGRK